VPWYAVLGNHDGLVQGNAPENQSFEAVATGPVKAFTNIEGYQDCPDDPNDANQMQDRLDDALGGADARPVPADPLRRFLSHKELVDAYIDGGGSPRGHGLLRAPHDETHDSRGGYYSFPISRRVRGISLDTIAYEGVANGHVPDPQFQWLERQLKRWSRRYWSKGKLVTNPDARNRLILLFSHHSSPTLNNPGADEGGFPYHCFRKADQPECQDGRGLKGLLHRFPNVVAWVNGHEHNNAVRRFPYPGKVHPERGFWEINTASHVDWPQQSRLIEMSWKPGERRRDPDTIMLFGTIVDHAADPDPDEDDQSLVEFLASKSRVESFFDACHREGQANCEAAGGPKHFNVKLVSKAPFDLGE
jgi:hypothetical protein